jgi:hypothetical protein
MKMKIIKKIPFILRHSHPKSNHIKFQNFHQMIHKLSINIVKNSLFCLMRLIKVLSPENIFFQNKKPEPQPL